MSKLYWLVLPLCLLLCACNEGDNPMLRKHTPIIGAQATAIAEGKFDAAIFKREMGPIAIKWDGKHYQPFGGIALDEFQAAFDRLVDAAEKSENEEAKRLLADVLHNMDTQYMTEKMVAYRNGFPEPTEEQKWWVKDKPAGDNSASGNAPASNAGG